MEHTGIILYKNKKSQYKVTVFDKERGKIDIFFLTTEKYPIGSIISYSLLEQRNSFNVKHFILEKSPCFLATIDILFLHHVLEIITFFSPSCYPITPVFNLSLSLYNEHSQRWMHNILLKKIFVCKLLLLIGNYDQIESIDSTFLHSFSHTPIDMIDPTSLDLAQEKNIDAWLHHCLASHPAISNFKTIHFLTKNRIV